MTEKTLFILVGFALGVLVTISALAVLYMLIS